MPAFDAWVTLEMYLTLIYDYGDHGSFYFYSKRKLCKKKKYY